jgi:hypothetical protein
MSISSVKIVRQGKTDESLVENEKKKKKMAKSQRNDREILCLK